MLGVREGTQLVIYVGHASGKRWWRNFTLVGLAVIPSLAKTRRTELAELTQRS